MTVAVEICEPRVLLSGSTSAAWANDPEILAGTLDTAYDFRFSGRFYENWGGMGEKWFRSAANHNDWYFITPDGSVSRWDRLSGPAPQTLIGQRIATLDSTFHTDPHRLLNAAHAAEIVQQQRLVTAAATDVQNRVAAETGTAADQIAVRSRLEISTRQADATESQRSTSTQLNVILLTDTRRFEYSAQYTPRATDTPFSLTLQDAEIRADVELQQRIVDRWQNQVRPALEAYTRQQLADRQPNGLYFAQIDSINTLQAAYRLRDRELLDDIARFHLIPAEYLQTHPDGYQTWLDPQGNEQLLSVSQFVYSAALAVRLFGDLPESLQTDATRQVAATYAPLISEHLQRWIFGPEVYYGPWASHVIRRYNFEGLIEAKRQSQLRQTPTAHPYTNALHDWDLFIIGATAELLTAADRNPTDYNLSSSESARLSGFLRNASVLLKSRLTPTEVLDFQGQSRTGMLLDVGYWDTHRDQTFVGFEELRFPEPQDQQLRVGGSWDISHARRWYHLFDSLRHNDEATRGRSTWDDALLGLANQFAYAVFNGDFDRPAFRNFFDGANGFYRVNYSGRTGWAYGPWDLSDAALGGGFGFWSAQNPDVDRAMRAVEQLIASDDPERIAFRQSHYGSRWRDGQPARIMDLRDQLPGAEQSAARYLLGLDAGFVKTLGTLPERVTTVYAQTGELQERRYPDGRYEVYDVDGRLASGLQTQSLAHFYRDTLGMFENGRSYFNWSVGSRSRPEGFGEHWIEARDANGRREWYFVLPDGNLYHWDPRTQRELLGDGEYSNTLVTQLTPNEHRDRQWLTTSARTVATGGLTVDGESLQIAPQPAAENGFVLLLTSLQAGRPTTQAYEVHHRTVAADAHSESSSTYHSAPSLDVPLPSPAVDQWQIRPLAGAAPLIPVVNSLPTATRVRVEDDRMLAHRVHRDWQLQQFHAAAFNTLGLREHWLSGPANAWFYILPDGRTYLWSSRSYRDLSSDVLIATLPVAYYEDPDRLANPSAVDRTYSVDLDTDHLRISGNGSMDRWMSVWITVLDGRSTTSVRHILRPD